MDGIYDIFLGGKPVGKAQVRWEGLYLRFRCCCDLSGEVIYRISVSCGGKTENLGVPVPEGDAFCLDTRIPARKLGAGTPQFRALPKGTERAGVFIPIIPEEPFAYLSRLGDAVLRRSNGQLGAYFPQADQSAISSSTGQ